MTDPTTITQARMTELLASETPAERARPMLPEGIPGPVQYRDQWWAIPENEEVYQRVTNPAVIARFNQLVERYTAGRAALADQQSERGAP